ncbi:hypothetical protein [Brevundimonas sp.]|uniref:hypothetical protein n=1 Tax=Brevundimonas sp. TaxID=1871086 RepID=UPI002731ABE2|nr:hypothetical protein [Brevundimonas sp.]MDP1913420.1 hypothetical protein [Brevundimonas sp.]
MSDFEFFFSFYGLLLGLSVAEVAQGFSRTLRSRRRLRIGWLTPLLGVVVMLDISSFWVLAWLNFRDFQINELALFFGLGIALAYYLAASVVFPADLGEWTDLDDYYDGHKRWVVGGMVVANVIAVGYSLGRAVAAGAGAPDLLPSAALLIFFFGMLGLIFAVRSRRANRWLLGVLLLAQFFVAVIGGLTRIMGPTA